MWALLILTVISSIAMALLAPTQKAKKGTLKDFTFPQVNDGDPIAYLAGRAKISGPGLTWYGDLKTKAIKQGGVFGIGAQTVGYKYYLGWQLVFCIGAGVHLKRLWFGTKSGQKEADAQENNPNFTNPNDPKVPTPIYEGDFTTGTMTLTDLEAFGGKQSGGGYSLDIEFYSGDISQPASPYLTKTLAPGFIPPYRRICHLVAHGYIGNTTQLQNMTAELERIPDPLELGVKATIGTEGDANPANVIYELLTNNFGAASAPVSRMNVSSFIAAGNTLYDEDEGISIAFGGSPQKLGTVQQDILRQIDATLYEDPLTGEVHLKLIRPDYDIADVLQIDTSNIIDVSNYATNLWSDTKNRIRLKYEDRQKDYDTRTAVGEDMANVSFQGNQVKPILVEHPYIKRKAHANRKAAKELAIYSTPISSLTVAALRLDVSLRPGSVVKLQYAPYKIVQSVFRIKNVSYGDLINNRILLELTGDKFAQSDQIFGVPSTGFTQPYTGNAKIVAHTLIEAPRFLNTLQPVITNVDAPRIMASPVQPSPTQTGYNLWLKTSLETVYVQTDPAKPYPDFAAVNGSIAQTGEANIVLQSITDVEILQSVSADQVAAGTNLAIIDDEIIGFEGYSLVGSVYTLTGVHRALLDTTPAAHASGSYMTFLDPGQVNSKEFGATDVVDVEIGSVASNSEQAEADAITDSIALTDRPMRPLPPAHVTFNSVLLSPAINNSVGVTVAWKRRDRLSSTIKFITDADEVPETGTEYFVYHDGFEENLGTGTSGTFYFMSNGVKTVQVYAKRDGLKSNVLTFSTTVSASASLSAPAAPASISANPAPFSNIVSWAASSGATQYDVYGLLGSGGLFSSAAIIGTVSGLTLTHRNLNADEEWSYWVVARNSGGSSAETGPAVSTSYGGGNGTTQQYYGDGPPVTLANDGDTYIDTSSNITYIQVSGVWVQQSTYDAVLIYDGTPAVSTYFRRLNAVRDFVWKAGLTGADIKADAPTGTVVITIYKYTSPTYTAIGTLTWTSSSGRTAPTISFLSDVEFLLNDEIVLGSPSDLHGLANLSATVPGYRV